MIKWFTADWCTPCQTMKKTLGEEIIDQLEVVDADHEPDEVSKYGIRSIPTFIKFNEEGEEVDRKNGSMSKADFLSWMDE